jgi:hypothetical protein
MSTNNLFIEASRGAWSGHFEKARTTWQKQRQKAGRRDGGRRGGTSQAPGAGPGVRVHLSVEDQAGLFYNQMYNYRVFKEEIGGRGSGKVKELVRP